MLYIGGINITDGNPLKLGNTQADKIMLGTNQVWINNYAPSALTDFSSTSSGANNKVTVIFSPAGGLPAPTYNLYENAILVASNISSGYIYTSLVTGNNTYRVDAVNLVATVPSNNSAANVWSGGTSYTATSTRTLTAGTDFPANTTITIQVMGGGGSGGGPWGNYAGHGGYASGVTSTSTSKSYGSSLAITIGGGGSSVSYATNNRHSGYTGGTSTCVVSRSGGGGGAGGVILSSAGSSGQSSAWGTGGGNHSTGGVGAGGGGSGNYFTYTNSGAGGRGEVRLSW